MDHLLLCFCAPVLNEISVADGTDVFVLSSSVSESQQNGFVYICTGLDKQKFSA